MIAVAAAFWTYGPVLHGAFLFDDYVFPFALPNFAAPLSAWIGPVRPVLYFTFWINAQLSKDDPNAGRALGAIRNLPGYSAMPKNGGMLDSCSIIQFEVWVRNGKPDN